MSRSPRFFVLLVALAITALPAAGTTYIPVSDAALVDRAAVIGRFEVLSSELAPTTGLTTEYAVRADTLLKGDLDGGTALVRIPGGESRSEGLRLSGLPSFRSGEHVLLFLVRRSDGAWGIAHLLLGAFHELDRAEGTLLVRPNLDEARSVDRRGRSVAGDSGVARDRDRFLAWISDRAAGRRRSGDYLVPVDGAALALRYTQFRDPGSQTPLRWFDFDGGGSVVWRAASSGPEGYADGGVAAVRAGLEAWTHLTQSTIDLQYGGLRPVDAGFLDADGVNTVLFEDPHHEIEEPFDCDEGGVLAIGGPYYVTQPLRYNHQNWYPIVEGVVITNAGISCFLLHSTNRLAEVFGHELGHTLGLGHSCGDSKSPPCASNPAFDDALMRASVHNDNRGARLGSDDSAGGRALYGPLAVKPPRAPTKLTVELDVNDATLAWTDRSNDEQGFRVYRRLGGGAFAMVGQTAAGQTSFLDPDLAAGTFSWEVRAFNQDGESEPSNRVTLVVEDVVPGAVRLAQTEIYGSEQSGTAVVTLERFGGHSGTLSARLYTGDLSASAPFDYEAKDVVVTWANGDVADKVVTLTVVDDFTAENGELLEVLLETVPEAGQARGFPLGAATVAIADNDGPLDCDRSDRSLCLLDTRFGVEVEWRNQRNGERGVGHAITGSANSGYFWFFQRENIELIVKVLDGRPVTGAYWVFYGGLSDVEYWVTVTDTATGARKLYRNPPGNICGVGDTGAFPESAAVSTVTTTITNPVPMASRATAPGTTWLAPDPATLTPRAGCAPDARTLCLLEGRFRVEVDWRNHRNGETGDGTAVTFSDQTGFFWFFDPSNMELVVKALDGQGVNGDFWFFYGALSDVEYTIRVTDTVTTAVQSYSNAGGNICGRGDITAFPGD